MRRVLLCSLLFAVAALVFASPDLVIAEHQGIATGEAEDFAEQTRHAIRAWHRISAAHAPDIEHASDPSHAATASNHAYIECLPDSRRSHEDPLVPHENFANEPGAMAVISYRIHIENPGLYYVWLRTDQSLPRRLGGTGSSERE